MHDAYTLVEVIKMKTAECWATEYLQMKKAAVSDVPVPKHITDPVPYVYHMPRPATLTSKGDYRTIIPRPKPAISHPGPNPQMDAARAAGAATLDAAARNEAVRPR